MNIELPIELPSCASAQGKKRFWTFSITPIFPIVLNFYTRLAPSGSQLDSLSKIMSLDTHPGRVSFFFFVLLRFVNFMSL